MKNGKDVDQILSSLQDICFFFLLASLLFFGTFAYNPTGDTVLYQCYAVGFWHGLSGLYKLGLSRPCAYMIDSYQDLTAISQHELLHAMQQWGLPDGLVQFVANQSSKMPYHVLPREYPLLAILPLSLGLLTQLNTYGVAFALWMLLFAGWIYVVLLRWRSRQATLAYSLYLVLAGWMTAAGRFDIIPAALTLFAVIYAGQKHWHRAFVLLALATLLKVYPAILLVPFLLDLQRQTPGKWYAWRRWLPMGVFAGICVLVIGVSLLLSVVGTLAPLGYFIARPVEIESFSASIFWIASLLWKAPLEYVNSFGSSNVVSPLYPYVELAMNVLLVIGLLSTWLLQWRGRIDLAMTCLLALLVVLMTGKVFSTQYLIWVIPLVAYVGQSNRWWLLCWTLIAFVSSWTLIMLLTHGIYPHITVLLNTPLFPTIRNFLLLGFILSRLVSSHFSPNR